MIQKPLKNTFGLDINNSAITAVEIARAKNGIRVVNFSRVELNPGIIEDDCIIVDREAFKNAMQRLLREGSGGPFLSKNVIVSIPEGKTFSHKLTVPREYAEDEQFIKLMAKDYIPVELNEAAVDYREISGDKVDVKMNFVAAQKYIIDSLITVLSDSGLKVIYVDVDKNSMVRACDNEFQKPGCDYMIMNVGAEGTAFSINGASGMSYNLDSEIGGMAMLQALKEGLKVQTLSDVQAVVNRFAGDRELSATEEYKNIENLLAVPMKKLCERVSELAVASATQDGIRVRKVFMIGSHSRMPWIISALKNIFPEAEVVPGLQYIQLNSETELYYAKAIGLALKALAPNGGSSEVNLLPHNEKEELFKRIITPIVTKSVVGATVMLTIFALLSGVGMAKSYLGYKISEREVEISKNKSDNPYLHQAAQESQEKSQLASQVTTILKDSLPITLFLSKIESYNKAGIQFVSLSYVSDVNEVKLRAKTDSRDSTESFTAAIQKDTYFSDLINPLSNLSGKGERFINIQVKVRMENILADLKAIQTKAEADNLKAAEDEAAIKEKDVKKTETAKIIETEKVAEDEQNNNVKKK